MEFNLKNLIKESLSVLLEGRLEDVKAKYSNVEGSEQNIDQLSQGDPSGNNKYLDWMANQYFTIGGVSIDQLIDIIGRFHSELNRITSDVAKKVVSENPQFYLGREVNRVSNNPKDINSYGTLAGVKKVVEAVEETKKESPERDRIYQDDTWTVIVPKSHAAACKYGVHSNWCVSTSNPTFFGRYTKERNALLFFIIWRKKRVETDKSEYKIAINARFKDWENPLKWDWYDMPDHQQDPDLMLHIFPKNMIDEVQSYLYKEGKAKGIIVEKGSLESLIKNNMTQLIAKSDKGTYFFTNNVEAFSGLENYVHAVRYKYIDEINSGKYRVYIDNNATFSVDKLADYTDNPDNYGRTLAEAYKNWIGWNRSRYDQDFFEYVYGINPGLEVNQELKEDFENRVKESLRQTGGMWIQTRTSDLKVGDKVRFKKGRGYWDMRTNPWNETVIDRSTNSGYLVTGPTNEYPKGKRFRPGGNTTMDVWHSFSNNIDLGRPN